MFLLVLVADATGGLLLVIVLAVRGLGRVEAPGGGPAGAPPGDLVPALLYGGFALAAGAAGVLLVRGGARFTGAAQLVLAVVVAGAALGAWRDTHDRDRFPATSPSDRLVDASQVVPQPPHRQALALDPAQQPGRALAQAGAAPVVVVRGDQDDVAGA